MDAIDALPFAVRVAFALLVTGACAFMFGVAIWLVNYFTDRMSGAPRDRSGR